MSESRAVFEQACLAAVRAYEGRLGLSWAKDRAWDQLLPEEKAAAAAQVKAVLAVLVGLDLPISAVLAAADEEDGDETGTG